MPGSHPHAFGDTTQVFRLWIHGISQRKEQHDALRAIRRIAIQVQKSRILVQRVLRRYSRKNASRIAEYIQHQLQEDAVCEQMTMGEKGPFTGSK